MNGYDIAQVVSKVMEQLSPKMTLEIAKELAHRVEEKAREIGVKAVVCIADGGARPILVHSMDDAYIASYDIAVGKAYTVVSLKMPTKNLKELASPGGSLYGIQFTNEGKIVIFGGGDPLYAGDKIIGGLGVSGGTEEQDTFLSQYGASVFEEILKNL